MSFAEQTDAVMTKRKEVEEKLNRKTQALSSLKSSGTHNTESKVSRFMEFSRLFENKLCKVTLLVQNGIVCTL